MTSSPQWKLRRLAVRLTKVYARHAPTQPAIAAFSTSALPAAEAYISAYDSAARFVSRARRETIEGQDSLTALRTLLEAWKPHLARELKGFDITTIGDNPAVPEDLIEDAVRLAEGLESIRDAAGGAPAWATTAATQIRAQCEVTERETDEAAGANAALNQAQAAVRETGAALEGHLTHFRQSLRAVLGRSHPDFQKLRAQRAAAPDEEDDPSAPSPSGPVAPAPNPPG